MVDSFPSCPTVLVGARLITEVRENCGAPTEEHLPRSLNNLRNSNLTTIQSIVRSRVPTHEIQWTES